MVSKRNQQLLLEARTDNHELHYGLRKLTVGVASVLLGTTVFLGGQAVHADTVNSGETQPPVEQPMVSLASTSQTSAVVSQMPASESSSSAASSVAVNSAQNFSHSVSQASPLVNQESAQASSQVSSGPNNEVSVIDIHSLSTNFVSNTGHQAQVLAQNKLQMTRASVNNNGGFDQSKWGTLDVSKWQGSYQDGYYKLTNYTGDKTHIIIPNEADFARAGRNVGRVGIARELTHSWFLNGQSPKSIAFSKTDGKKVMALGQNFDSAFSGSIQWNDKLPGNTWYMGHYNLTDFDGSNLDVSQVTSINHLFDADQISDLSSLSSWNTSQMVSMAATFLGNVGISDLQPLSHWDVSHVQYFGSMFALYGSAYPGDDIKDHGGIVSLQPLSGWNVSSAKDTSYMFEGCRIQSTRPLLNWNVSHVSNMDGMFEDNRLSDLSGVARWDVSHVTTLQNMFANNANIKDLSPLSDWQVNNVTTTVGFLASNQIVNLQPLANWNVSNDTQMGTMFASNQISDLAPLKNWNTSRVTDMSGMFQNNKISSLLPLQNWQVGSVTTMYEMFFENQIDDLSPLANWDVSHVTDFSLIFGNNKIVSLEPLRHWNISSATNLYAMFEKNQIRDLSPLEYWNTSRVTNMGSLFSSNQVSDLSSLALWDMSGVTDISSMFADNKIVDLSSLSQWNVSNVTNMSGLFQRNSIGSQVPLAHWKMNKVTDVSDMLSLNPIILADLRYWPWNSITSYTTLIQTGAFGPDYQTHHIVLVKSSDYSKLSSQVDVPYMGKEDVITTDKSNQLVVNVHDAIDMPTIYATDDTTTDAETLAERLVKQTRESKLRDYASKHNIAFSALRLNAADPTNHKYDAPEIMANQAYHSGSATVTYTYVDDNNHGMVIGTPMIFAGYLGTSQTPTWTIPQGYQLAKNQTLPTTITLNADGNFKIHLLHVVTPVDPTRPINPGQKTPGGKVINGGHTTDLNKTVTRTIILKTPGQADHMVVQTVHLTRSASVDNVTGNVTYGAWSTGSWAAYTVPAKQYYTIDKSSVTAQHVDGNTTNTTVVVNYVPIEKTVTLTYIDDTTGNMLSIDTFTGQIGSAIVWKVAPHQKVMDYQGQGYEWVSGDAGSLTKVSDSDAKNKFVVHLKHGTQPASHDYTVTRTINYLGPDGKQLKPSTVQTVIFHRTGIQDKVTQDITWNATPAQRFAAVNALSILGYKTSITSVPAVTVNWDDQKATVDVHYQVANSTVTINFVDGTGQVIATTSVTGQVGSIVNIAANIPDGWIAYSEAIPNKVLIGAMSKRVNYMILHRLAFVKFTDGVKAGDIIPKTKSKTFNEKTNADHLITHASYTVNIWADAGHTRKLSTKIYHTDFVRSAVVDAITGDVYYYNWSEGGAHVFAGFTRQAGNGYQAVVVPLWKATQANPTKTIDLVAQPQELSGTIQYQTTDGTVVLNQAFTGNDAVVLTAPKGYTLMANDMMVMPTPGKDQTYVVYVRPTQTSYTASDKLPAGVNSLSKTITRTIHITEANGHVRMITQRVHFTRTATVKADGSVEYTDWKPTGRAVMNNVFLPKRYGYHVVIDGDMAKKNVTADMSDSVVNVKYVKD